MCSPTAANKTIELNSDDEFYQDFLLTEDNTSTLDYATPSLEPVQGCLDHIDLLLNENQPGCSSTCESTWTSEELALLSQLARKHKKNWKLISKQFSGKCASELEAEWLKQQETAHKRGRWTSNEDQAILDLYLRHGADWKLMSKRLKARQPDSIKHRFYTAVKKQLTPEQEKASKRLHRQGKDWLFSDREFFAEDRTIQTLFTDLSDGSLPWESLTVCEIQPQPLTAEDKRKKLQELLHLSDVYETLISKTQEELASLKD